MVLEGDPLEPRFKMKVGTAQAGDPSLCGGAKKRRRISFAVYATTQL